LVIGLLAGSTYNPLRDYFSVIGALASAPEKLIIDKPTGGEQGD
jgi:hypothetical protein